MNETKPSVVRGRSTSCARQPCRYAAAGGWKSLSPEGCAHARCTALRLVTRSLFWKLEKQFSSVFAAAAIGGGSCAVDRRTHSSARRTRYSRERESRTARLRGRLSTGFPLGSARGFQLINTPCVAANFLSRCPGVRKGVESRVGRRRSAVARTQCSPLLSRYV